MKATPQVAVPVGRPVGSNTPYVHETSTPYVAVGQPGQWSDGLFSCFNDPRLCLVAFCCPGILVGQLFERVKRERNVCAFIVGCAFMTGCIVAALKSTCPPVEIDSRGRPINVAEVPTTCAFSDTLAGLTTLVLAILFMIARSHVRREHRISPTCCGVCDDCCCALCCMPCSASQLMRHLGAHDAMDYRLCSPVGV